MQDRFASIWAYIASVCFHSEEAFARYCNTDAGLDALRGQPLMPVTAKQSELLKHDRADEVLAAQRRARGSAVETVSGPHDAAPWRSWPGRYHCDADVNAAEWSRRSVELANAGAIKFGNHVCLPQVCYKKKKARFCRMLYWHWQECTDQNGEPVARRLHGLPLQEASAPTDLRIHNSLPHRGLPALERTHPFHFKMTPAAMLAACCNNDLSVLFRFGGPSNPDPIARKRTFSEMLKDMIETITDHEYYTGGYMIKGNDAAHGLLHCLHDAVLQHARCVASASSAVEPPDAAQAAANAQRLFRRLIVAMNKRHRVGFPSVYAYLFGKPSFYCSHAFVTLNVTAQFGHFEECISKRNFFDVPASAHAEHPAVVQHELPASTAPTYQAYDYNWRPMSLDSFPLYFFTAATEVSGPPAAAVLPWPQLEDESGQLRDHPCYERRLRDDRFVLRSKRVRGVDGVFAILRDPDTGEPLRRHDHYRRLRVDKPWRVPELQGYMPQKPAAGDSPERRGRYALYVMLLFRPWRSTRVALATWTGFNSSAGVCEDDIWKSIDDEHSRWRLALSRSAAEARASSEEPLYNSPAWWAILTYEKLRNMELTALPKSATARRRPTDASGNALRVVEGDESSASSEDPHVSEAAPTASTGAASAASAAVAKPEAPTPTARWDAETKRCGDVGGGFFNHMVYSQENAHIRARGLEATYARTFVDAANCHGLGMLHHMEVGPREIDWAADAGMSPAAVREVLKRQQEFFAALDAAADDVRAPDVASMKAPGDDRATASPTLCVLQETRLVRHTLRHAPSTLSCGSSNEVCWP